MKKALSVLLAVLIAAGIFTAVPAVSSAADYAQTEIESNDSFSDAQLITLGNSLTGEMPAADDLDIYKFISTEDGKINISIDNLTPNETAMHGSWSFFIFGPDQRKEFAMAEIDLKETGVTLPFIGAKAGNYYYLMIYGGPRYASAHSYRIRTSFTKGKGYEKENNGTESDATSYILANKMSGTIGSDSHDGDWNEVMDIDYYNIKAPAKGTMTLNFNHKARAPKVYNEGGWYCNLYKHNNGGNLTVSDATVRIETDDTKTIYKASVDKNAEFWFTVQSGFDTNLTGASLSYASDVVGEPYNITSTFVLAAKPSLKAKATKNAITLTAKKLSDVTGYEIEIKNGKKFKKIATTKKPALSYKKSGLKKNTKYTFRVRAYLKKDDTKYYGKWVTITAKTKKK